MVKEHPLWRGFWLAAAVVLAMVFLGHVDVSPFYAQAARLTGQSVPGDPFVIAMALMIVLGAFLASLPGRLTAREQKDGDKPTWQALLMSFLGGMLLILGLGVAGGGMVAGLLFSGVGAWVFLLVACVTGYLLIRFLGGERA